MASRRTVRRKRRGRGGGLLCLTAVLGAFVGAAAAGYVAYLYAVDATVRVRCDSLAFDSFTVGLSGITYSATADEQEVAGFNTTVASVTVVFGSEYVNVTWMDAFLRDYVFAAMYPSFDTVFDESDVWEVSWSPDTPTYDVGFDVAIKVPRGLVLNGVIVKLYGGPVDGLPENASTYVGVTFVADLNVTTGYESTVVELNSVTFDDTDMTWWGENVYLPAFIDVGGERYLDAGWVRTASEDVVTPALNVTVTTTFSWDDVFSTGFSTGAIW